MSDDEMQWVGLQCGTLDNRCDQCNDEVRRK